MEIIIRASEFKAKCLQLLNDVRKGDIYLITKRGVPLAKLSSLQTKSHKLFGAMKDSFVENADICQSISSPWTVENE
jgi:prevent-host-death family protein